MLATILGGVVGYFFCYYLVLDAVGRMGTSLFWNGLPNGQFFSADALLHSTTFWQLTVSTILGALTGRWIARRSGSLDGTP